MAIGLHLLHSKLAAFALFWFDICRQLHQNGAYFLRLESNNRPQGVAWFWLSGKQIDKWA